ncbi:hypothetical protein Csa_012842 [Cucumis sativus]|uniref:Uncharacterized protein n=1 Tax=Cucumis sativus TaxID=3659 RepID=A0A0A0L1R8_CUCSA|nr:hypothetical protein Csa_012842 [Cucumis sativus]
MVTQKLFIVSMLVAVTFSCFASSMEGDDLWNCVIPCSNNNGDILCNTACIEQDEGAGFCVPKLPGISDMKVCCCNNGR